MTDKTIPSETYALGVEGGWAPGYDLTGIRALVFDPAQDPKCNDLVAVYPASEAGSFIAVLESVPGPIPIGQGQQAVGVVLSAGGEQTFLSHDNIAAMHRAVGCYLVGQTGVVHPPPKRNVVRH